MRGGRADAVKDLTEAFTYYGVYWMFYFIKQAKLADFRAAQGRKARFEDVVVGAAALFSFFKLTTLQSR